MIITITDSPIGILEIILISITIIIWLIAGIILAIKKSSKTKIKNLNWIMIGIIIIAVIAAFITPPDMLSNIVVSIPTIVVYIIILKKTRLIKRKSE